jgi:dihydropteroate synthase
MGILNVTPDSFSDGGRYEGVDVALAQGDALLEAGAAILDVGGESTRPGREETVPADVELARVLPVVQALERRHPRVIITVDTVKAAVARATLEAGAAAINDVSALRLDPAMGATVATARAGLVLMHSRGHLLEIASYAHATYEDVVGEVVAELRAAITAAGDVGVPPRAIAVDPGFGFSKTVRQEYLALRSAGGPTRSAVPSWSDPRAISRAVTGQPVDARDATTAAARAGLRGARIFRVHDVAAAHRRPHLPSAWEVVVPLGRLPFPSPGWRDHSRSSSWRTCSTPSSGSDGDAALQIVFGLMVLAVIYLVAFCQLNADHHLLGVVFTTGVRRAGVFQPGLRQASRGWGRAGCFASSAPGSGRGRQKSPGAGG